MSHLGLSTPESLILCTWINYESCFNHHMLCKLVSLTVVRVAYGYWVKNLEGIVMLYSFSKIIAAGSTLFQAQALGQVYRARHELPPAE